jgi:hypothetical protein
MTEIDIYDLLDRWALAWLYENLGEYEPNQPV